MEAHVAAEELHPFLEGELSERRTRAIADHLSECTSCRSAADREVTLLADLRAPAPEVDGLDLTRSILDAVERLPAARPLRWGRWAGLGASALVLTVAVAVLSVSPESDGWRAKGGEASHPPDLGAWLRVYQVADDRGAFPVHRSVSAKTAFAFTYGTEAASPFSYLMIFGIDQGGDVHWYYPGHTDPTLDPRSISIERGVTDVRLPDQISHDLPTGPYVIYGLFTRRALSVSEVEARLRSLGSAAGSSDRLPFSASGQRRIALEVR